jgi:hypothetical protein
VSLDTSNFLKDRDFIKVSDVIDNNYPNKAKFDKVKDVSIKVVQD